MVSVLENMGGENQCFTQYDICSNICYSPGSLYFIYNVVTYLYIRTHTHIYTHTNLNIYMYLYMHINAN